MGGGGPITVYPFAVNLTLGEARQDGVQGLYGALPPAPRNGTASGWRGLSPMDFSGPLPSRLIFKP